MRTSLPDPIGVGLRSSNPNSILRSPALEGNNINGKSYGGSELTSPIKIGGH